MDSLRVNRKTAPDKPSRNRHYQRKPPRYTVMQTRPVRLYTLGSILRRHGVVACLSIVLAIPLYVLSPAPAALADPVDMNLVIAVDISDSIDPDELQLQRKGYIAAFEDPEIVQAIKSGKNGRISIAYFEWSDSTDQTLVIDWMIVSDGPTASAFSTKLKLAPVQRGHFTSISSAISYALALLRRSPHEGDRRVIDISGDGRNNDGPPLTSAREAALSWNVTINGLPIDNERSQQASNLEPGQIAQYYRDEVIGGPDAFVVVAKSYVDIERAISRKLLREIARKKGDDALRRAAAR
jgi:Protein of unknown function (DUF1194)